LEGRQLEGLRRVGLDEKSFGLGQDYVSVLSDLDQSRVLEVVPGNDKQSGCALWQSVPPAQRQHIEAAAMDMSAGFAAATAQETPQVVTVHDKLPI
jgi:transposase